MTDDEMGRAWNSTGEIRNVYRPWPENLKTRNHLENLGVDGRIILKCTYAKEMGWEGVDSFYLCHGRDQKCAVNAAMKFRVSYKTVNLFSCCFSVSCFSRMIPRHV
jgi:hypothetical protein